MHSLRFLALHKPWFELLLGKATPSTLASPTLVVYPYHCLRCLGVAFDGLEASNGSSSVDDAP